MSVIIHHVVKRYGTQVAVDDVSFAIESGKIVGLIGPNGAGKTTLMKIICGLLIPDSGYVTIGDIPVTSESAAIRNKIGYLPENNPLYPDMYIREYLGYVSDLYTSKKMNIETAIELTGLKPEIHKRIGQLSKGYRQRVGLAQALIHNPEVLILDEPTTGLDPNQIIEIRELISAAGQEKTVLLSTHIMQEVEAICDRVIIMNNGEILADDDPQNIKKSMPEAFQTVVVEFDREVGENLLKTIEGVNKAKNVNATSWIIQSDVKTDVRPKIFNFAVKYGFTVLSMQKRDKKLEDVFHELTSG